MEIVDSIAGAIENAHVGYSARLVRLVDGIATWELRYTDDSNSPILFEGKDGEVYEELAAHVAATMRTAQARAVLLALEPTFGSDAGLETMVPLEKGGRRVVIEGMSVALDFDDARFETGRSIGLREGRRGALEEAAGELEANHPEAALSLRRLIEVEEIEEKTVDAPEHAMTPEEIESWEAIIANEHASGGMPMRSAARLLRAYREIEIQAQAWRAAVEPFDDALSEISGILIECGAFPEIPEDAPCDKSEADYRSASRAVIDGVLRLARSQTEMEDKIRACLRALDDFRNGAEGVLAMIASDNARSDTCLSGSAA